MQNSKQQRMRYKNMLSDQFYIIAGPCSVEDKMQLQQCVEVFKNYDNVIALRGGAFKPRTNPDSFQGLGATGINLLETIKEEYHIKIVSEITSESDLELFKNVDIIQIGARNMQNFALLKKVARLQKPIILKRGFGNTIDELLASAQYISKEGNEQIILCERGIRTFNTHLRYTLDLGIIPVLKQRCNYQVIVDPSHAAGDHQFVIPLAKAAKAVGADGIIIEVHPNPPQALSDSAQQLNLLEFNKLEEELNSIK